MTRNRGTMWLTVLAAFASAVAQWQSTELPVGFAALASSDSLLLAGSGDGGVHASNDNGGVWRQTNQGLTDADVSRLLVVGDTFYAGTYSGVYKSINGAASWTLASGGLTNTQITAMAANRSFLFVGTYGGGVYRSADAGDSWSPSNTGLPVDSFNCVSALAADGPLVYAGTNGGPLYRSTDEGLNWTAQADTDAMAICVVGRRTVIGGGRGLYVSLDSAETLVRMLTGLSPIALIYSLSCDGSILLAGTNSGVYASRDTGATWADVSLGLPLDEFGDAEPVMSVLLRGNYAFAACLSGVYRLYVDELVNRRATELSTTRQAQVAVKYRHGMPPTVSITLTAARPGPIRATVTDLTGRSYGECQTHATVAGRVTVVVPLIAMAQGSYVVAVMAQGSRYAKCVIVTE